MVGVIKLDERFEIKVVVVELLDNEGTFASIGNVYDNFKAFKKKHPNSSYMFGFVVFDTENNCVPEEFNDWYESPEEAISDFEENFA